MSTVPISIARVSDLLQASVATSSIAASQSQLLTVENQISTGKQVNDPSDNPASAAVIQQLQKSLNDQTAYATNLQHASSNLSEVDSTLNSLEDVLQQATSTASQNVSSDVTATQRQAAAQVIQTLYSQAMSIGNTQFNGSYLYGGNHANQAVFVSGPNGVTFNGSSTVLQNSMDANTSLAFQVSGDEVFGATTSVNSSVNLAPQASASTRIIDLGGATGTGVTLGSIQIGNGSTTKIVDLSNADTLGDVATAINNAQLAGVTATVANGGIELDSDGTSNITVNDLAGGNTAASLGIATPTGNGAGANVTGQDLQAKVTALTPLASLKGGAGIDLTSGMTITVGQKSQTLTFANDTTVQDLINQIDGAGLGVKAQINASGTGINLVNTVQGASLSIAENGGTTAADLGLQTFSATTPLSQLNGGAGVGTATGGQPDFVITAGDGTTYNITLAGAKTVQNVLDDINTATGGTVTASLATTGNGIVLTDSSGGSGTLSVQALNGSTAAKDLGLTQQANGNTITGSDVGAVQQTGVLADLAALQTALNNNDQNGITAAASALQNDYNRVVAVRGKAGAQVDELTAIQTQQQNQQTATQSLLSNLQDTDMTTAITRFTTLQTQLQAEYETQARSLNLSLIDFLR